MRLDGGRRCGTSIGSFRLKLTVIFGFASDRAWGGSRRLLVRDFGDVASRTHQISLMRGLKAQALALPAQHFQLLWRKLEFRPFFAGEKPASSQFVATVPARDSAKHFIPNSAKQILP